MPLRALESRLPPGAVLTDASRFEPYAVDWRRKFFGRPLAVVFASAVSEVQEIVRWAQTHRVGLVPQGGNTGLSGGATPSSAGDQVVLNLSRMTHIRERDAHNKTITVDAGVTMQTVQDEAERLGLLFPLDLTARGSATIGGNLSTNAGGTAVLRYGNARALCLGLEVVTAQGEVWDGLRGLRKDNTGYDLRDLFIGSEGTLGIITGAVLALHPRPAGVMTALASVADARAAVLLLERAQGIAGANLTGFEFMTPLATDPVAVYFPQFAKPSLGEPSEACVLLEVSHPESAQEATRQLESVLQGALEEGLATDALVAQNMTQAKAFWNLREHVTFASAEDGPQVKFDIALPISSLPEFCEATTALLAQYFPGARAANFGHLGDGNLHFNVAAPEAMGAGLSREARHEAFGAYVKQNEDGIRRVVHDQVVKMNGSISAEHGLGQLRRDEAARYKSPIEMDLMQRLKNALDPLGILNPNKVLRLPSERA